jgi:hypothetical protein
MKANTHTCWLSDLLSILLDRAAPLSRQTGSSGGARGIALLTHFKSFNSGVGAEKLHPNMDEHGLAALGFLLNGFLPKPRLVPT